MGDDNEQRIQRVMDIFSSPMHAPSLNSSPIRIPDDRNAASTASTTRPWERADLYRRLVTFKSTTWFGKPAPAGPVACARRGWVNAELDMVACETCGSRLSFSLPSTWSKQQAELAGHSFSERLSSGHKENCLWRTNISPEELAYFPPTPPSELVQKYDGRVQALSTLSAIPIVSSAAVDAMKTSKGAAVSFLLTRAEGAVPQSMDADEREAVQKLQESYELFHQAQKLISLCGWEVRRLGYTVEQQASKADGDDHGPKVSLADTSRDADPASAVLECGLCKASVGLWNFPTVNRSSLSLDAVLAAVQGSTKKTTEAAAAAEPAAGAEVRDDTLAGQLVGLDLSLTIAGGSRPTRAQYPPGLFPASLPIAGVFYQYDGEPAKVTEQKLLKRGRAEDGDGSRKKARTEAPEQPTSQAGKNNKRGRADEEDELSSKKLKTTEGNAHAVELHQNSEESVECSMQQSENGMSSAQAAGNIAPGESGEFNPLCHHRYFCPWISGNGDEKPCGWQLTVEALYSQRSVAEKSIALPRTTEAVNAVRKLLGGKGKEKDKGKSVVVT